MQRLLPALFVLCATAVASAQLSFEVASIKPNASGLNGGRLGPENDRFIAINMPVRTLIQEAFGVNANQITNAPKWVEDERFDINAKASRAFASRDEARAMLKALLADRFQLVTHTEEKPTTVYALRIAAKDGALGPSLHRASADCAALRAANPPPGDPCGMMTFTRAGITGKMRVRGLALNNLVALLSRELRETVVDETGLQGPLDWDLTFRPMFLGTGVVNRERWPEVDPDAPQVTAAIAEQLGLEVKRQSGAVASLVVDRIERPTPD